MPALPRGWLSDTVALYGRVFRHGAALALRNWPVGLVMIAYELFVEVVGIFSAPFGIAGGFLRYLALVACASSWLSLVAQVLRTGRVRLNDVPTSFATYFGDLLNVGFMFFGLGLIDSFVLAPFPLLGIVFRLAIIVFLNAVPEVVYVQRHSGPDVFVQSYRFIGENWIEWFPANVLLSACLLVVFAVPMGPYGIVSAAVFGTILYLGMVVRVLLF